ncbi:E3 SUMO-protein ligase ZBED1-like [Epinephelus lanceolatus]
MYFINPQMRKFKCNQQHHPLRKIQLLQVEWGINDKVTCLVTDGAANMGACAREMHLRHTICVAHTMNLMVKKALDHDPVVCDIRAKLRKMVGYFRSSTTAKERLTQVQEQMGRPKLKLTQEVETRWNSTYHMLQRVFELREPVGAALANLSTDITPLSSEEYGIIAGCLRVLAPFNDATVELSEEKRVSGSKVIPLLSMLDHSLEEEVGNAQTPHSTSIVNHLRRQLRERLYQLQSMSIMSLSTLLDPRFKSIGFFSPSKAAEAVNRLTTECAAVIRNSSSSSSSSPPPPQPSTSEVSQPVTQGNKLWRHLDDTVMQARGQNVTADATVEVQRYMMEPNIGRREDPLEYWDRQKHLYPHLHKLALAFLSTPASSVPCERVFSKAGEIISKKRNHLSPTTVEKLFLNKNE